MEINMTCKKITDSEISERLVASLPTRPNAPISFGGRGFSAAEMKSAFDRLGLLIAERFNALLDDIQSGSLAAELRVGDYTLEELLTLLAPSLSK
jgi:hypothetical protein